MTSITQAKDILKARLLAALPSVLDVADADAQDGVVTPPPYVVETTEKTSLAGFPAIELIGRSSRKTPVDTAADCYTHTVVVAVTLAGDDEDTLTRWCERYLWAIRQFGNERGVTSPFEDQALADQSEIIAGPEQYSSMVHGRDAGLEVPFLRGAFIELAISTYE